MQRIIILAIIILLAASHAAGFDSQTTRFVYRETDKSTRTKEYVLTKTPTGWTLTLDKPGEHTDLGLDERLRTVSEQFTNTKTGETIQVTREGGALVMRGKAGGEAVNETRKLGDKPWVGSMLLLRDFALSDRAEERFYTTQPDVQKVIEMKAIREGVEDVQVDGKTVKAVRVKVTVPDMRALFWSSRYWFRVSDGVWVRSVEQRGGPGTPDTLVELIEESRS